MKRSSTRSTLATTWTKPRKLSHILALEITPSSFIEIFIQSQSRKYGVDESLVRTIHYRADDFDKGQNIVAGFVVDNNGDRASSGRIYDNLIEAHVKKYGLDPLVICSLHERYFKNTADLFLRIEQSQLKTYTPEEIVDGFLKSNATQFAISSAVLRVVYEGTTDFMKGHELAMYLGSAYPSPPSALLRGLVRSHALKYKLEEAVIQTIYDRYADFELAERAVAHLSLGMNVLPAVRVAQLFEKLVSDVANKHELEVNVVHDLL